MNRFDMEGLHRLLQTDDIVEGDPAFHALSKQSAVDAGSLPINTTAFVDASRDRSAAQHSLANIYFDHSSGTRVNTDALIASSLRKLYPQCTLTIIPLSTSSVIQYAVETGNAKVVSLSHQIGQDSYEWKTFKPASTRLDGDQAGSIQVASYFNKYEYTWKDHTFLIYEVSGRDGSGSYPQITNQYLLTPKASDSRQGSTVPVPVDELIRESGAWTQGLRNEIWVFNQGYWQKDRELFKSVQKARWEDVILDEESKKAIRADANRFFDARDRYEKLRVAWKRGVIYYGPPGNGKTISIKALMHELYQRSPRVQTLYVRTLASFSGPEFSLGEIFRLARREAPCLLVFEDLDSLINDRVRSFFLNEVDGLRTNDGVLMIGSTNYLERLDPGISKRPSRFDRKYLFPKPNFDERVKYAEYWRHKLASAKAADSAIAEDDMVHVGEVEVDFPKELSPEIARITDDFSFAFLNEAFVATLLSLAAQEPPSDEGVAREDKGGKDRFGDLVFWREMKKQVKNLRAEL